MVYAHTFQYEVLIKLVVGVVVLGLFSIERVVGYPFITFYLIFASIRSLSFWKQMLILMLVSIVIGSLYGVSYIGVYALSSIMFYTLLLRSFRNQTKWKIAILSVGLVFGLAVLGLSIDSRGVIYLILQVAILSFVHYTSIFSRFFNYLLRSYDR